MAEHLDEAFCKIVRDITDDIKEYPREDRNTVAGWLQQIGKEVENDEDRRSRNEYGRYLRYIVQSGEELPEYFQPVCAREYSQDAAGSASTSTDVDGVAEVCEAARDGEITTVAEFVYSLRPFVADHGSLFREILDKDLKFFREIVDETVDRRVQDEADVMMHTQNDIKQKFQLLTEAMVHRTMKIRQRLFEISPKYDWARDGKNKARIANLVKVEHKEMSGDPNVVEKLLHQVFMRSQWLKKELARLQEENGNLKAFLAKFRMLAAERRATESHVPRMLCREKKALERELGCLQSSYNKNLEVVNALYIEHHRCIKPLTEITSSEYVHQ